MGVGGHGGVDTVYIIHFDFIIDARANTVHS